MKLWRSDPKLHLFPVDTTFCLPSCLFALLLVCLLSCLFAFSFVCSHPCFYACHVYHVFLLFVLFICSLHLFLLLLVYWFLVFALACTHMEQGRMELGHGLPGISKKGRGCKHMDISQVAAVNRSRSLALPFGYVLF